MGVGREELFEAFVGGFMASGEGGNGETYRDKGLDPQGLRSDFEKWLAQGSGIHPKRYTAAEVLSILAGRGPGREVCYQTPTSPFCPARPLIEALGYFSEKVVMGDTSTWAVRETEARLEVWIELQGELVSVFGQIQDLRREVQGRLDSASSHRHPLEMVQVQALWLRDQLDALLASRR